MMGVTKKTSRTYVKLLLKDTSQLSALIDAWANQLKYFELYEKKNAELSETSFSFTILYLFSVS